MLSKGLAYEQLAEKYLHQQGLHIKDRNYRIRKGEIDLIAIERNTIIFVEVRFRKSKHFGTAEETITKQKQHKISLTAQHYLSKHNLWGMNARFDVIAISPTQTGNIKVNWIKNAFS